MDEETRYEAVCSRDARFDGEFFLAVATTGIYCRPSCPAVTPKRKNVRFFPTAAAAQGSGFRACRRCRPDAVPGSAEWNARADVVGRAVRLIGDGVVDREGVAGLAVRLGYSARQIQRQLTAELGAGPIALARAQRAHTARVLLQTTELPVTEIAFAAGFASVRQFNQTIREIYASSPSELRAASGGTGSKGARGGAAKRHAAAGHEAGDRAAQAGIPLRLAYRGPYAAREMFGFLAARAVPGVEEVQGATGDRVYRRTLSLPHGIGVAEVRERAGPLTARGRRNTTANGAGTSDTLIAHDRGGPPSPVAAGNAHGTAPANGHPSMPGRQSRTGGRRGAAAANSRPTTTTGAAWLECRLRLGDLRDLTTAVQRLRRLFDLDADPYAVAERLGADRVFGPLVEARPGLRSPGAAEPEEMAVRVVLGQGMDVESARRLTGALVRAYGKPLAAPDGGLTHLFPQAEQLAGASLDELELPAERRAALRFLAAALADRTVVLDPGADRDAAERLLGALPGIGPSAAALIRMRALGDPDVFPPGPHASAAESRRPWRSYAWHHLLLDHRPVPRNEVQR
ncbi:AlkA N-terminal domain-containing protein [Streptomyces sp. NPDC004647]|uniref:DNA-3-methyladenine glycosylase 2 family protein n=1 Tax=Streptomyces sp. NPDC004647 TaxID=3154671 RepID=UPI0033A70354